MVWPTDNLTKTHLDASTDSPANARAELEALIDKVKLILAEVTAGATVWHSGNDGSGSGLDADLLDSQSSNYYLDAGNMNAGTLPLARIPATLTGKDADTLDGQHGSFYQDAGNLNAGTMTRPISLNSGDNLTAMNNVTKFYAGQFNSDGTAIDLPTGWSSSRTAVGEYTLTHNLGSANYSFVTTAQDSGGSGLIESNWVTKSTNTITIKCQEKGATSIASTDADIDFILIVN